MMRRILVPLLFVTCGFVGGMVLTGRFRAAEEARAESRPAGSAQLSAPPGMATLPSAPWMPFTAKSRMLELRIFSHWVYR